VTRKKVHNTNLPKPKEFHITPFGALKGINVPETAPAVILPPVVQKASASVDSGLDLFLQEVADVRPLQPSAKKPLQAGLHPLQKTARKTHDELIVFEENSFLEEIGKLKMDTKFTDSVPDDGELQLLSGNRLRQVKLGIVTVNHQLDLHGLTREEALEALPRFLRNAVQKGQKAVLVITGKGNHSPEAPVLHQAVASWLRDGGKSLVLEFAPAPREMGGSGAYVVFLRQAPLPAQVAAH